MSILLYLAMYKHQPILHHLRDKNEHHGIEQHEMIGLRQKLSRHLNPNAFGLHT